VQLQREVAKHSCSVVTRSQTARSNPKFGQFTVMHACMLMASFRQVDEVHERTVENDFLLLTLKSLLKEQAHGQSSRPGGPLHLCLMSATMDSSILSDYYKGEFSRVPRVKVSGRTFPVTTIHLEDALHLTRHTVDPGADWCRHSQAAQRRASRKEVGRRESERAEAPPSESDFMRRFPSADSSVHRALAALDQDAINIALVVDLVLWFRRCGSLTGALRAAGQKESDRERNMEGDSMDRRGEAILVFLPGTKEIEDVKEALVKTSLCLQAEQRAWVLPLHGALPAGAQRALRSPASHVQ